jgi:hypothetical protein
MTDEGAYTLEEFFAGREAAWANVPACAQHYPKWCDCEFVPPVGSSHE